MQFNNLSAFYLYFFSLFIVVFYFLQGIKNKKKISSLKLWRNLNKESHSFSFKLRFDPDILFFLQLLIFMLLVTSLLQPLLVKKGTNQQRIVFLIDRSASMQAVDQNPNRFKTSVNKALNYLDDIGNKSQIALVTAGKNPKLIQEFTNKQDNLKRKLNNLQPTAEVLNLKKSLEFARALFPEGEKENIIFFTDGSFQVNSKGIMKGIKLVESGSPSNNIGIIDFDIRPKTGQPGEYEIFLKIGNYAKRENKIRMEITAGRRIYFRDKFILQPEETKSANYTLKIREPKKIQIELLNQDIFSLDNKIVLWLGTELNKEYRILQLGQQNYFLERGLLVIPGVKFFNKESLKQVDIDQYDLVIFNKLKPPKGFRKNGVFIGVAPPDSQIEKKVNNQVLAVTDWERENSLLRFVNLNQVKTKNTIFLKNEGDFRNLVSTTNGALMLSREELNYKWLFLGFNFSESNFPLQLGFPVFLSNMIEWFQPKYYNPTYNQIKPGEIYKLSPFRDKVPSKVLNPEGKAISYNTGINQYNIENTSFEGLYQIVFQDNSELKFTVNLASSKESNLLQSYSKNKKENRFKADSEPVYIQLWPNLILAALSILLLEWALYHKFKFWSDKHDI